MFRPWLDDLSDEALAAILAAAPDEGDAWTRLENRATRREVGLTLRYRGSAPEEQWS